MTIINKITGRDISTEYLALMSGLITNDEFFKDQVEYVNEVIKELNNRIK